MFGDLAISGRKNQTSKNFILGSVVGTLALTLAMVVLNYIYAVPLYAKFANFDIGQFIGLYKYLLLWLYLLICFKV